MNNVTIKSSLTGRVVTATVTPLFLLENDEETLVQNLTDCGCQPVGETNVVDCECYLEWEDCTITFEENKVAEVEQTSETQINEYIENLRSQADKIQQDALKMQGTNLEVKLVATMYAYREIADDLKTKFIDQT